MLSVKNTNFSGNQNSRFLKKLLIFMQQNFNKFKIYQIFKIHLSIFISFCSSAVFTQNIENGDLNINIAGFYLNDLSVDINNSEGFKLLGKLESLEFGFKGIKLSKKNNSRNSLKLNFQGPEFKFTGLEFSLKSYNGNWIEQIEHNYLRSIQEPAITGLNILANSIDSFKVVEKKHPLSYDDLFQKNYIHYDQYPFKDKEWEFRIDEANILSATLITKTTLIPNLKIFYNSSTKEFYGDYHQMPPIKEVPWNIKFSASKISQNFSNELRVALDDSTILIDLFQKKGQLSIDGISIRGNRQDNVNDFFKFGLGNILFESSNIAINGSFEDSSFIVHRANINFNLQDFEIDIPETLAKESRFNIILEKIGVWNGLLRIKLIKINIKILNEELGEFAILFHSPFLKLSIEGDLLLRQRKDQVGPKISVQQTVAEIDPISLGIRTLINEWEKENDRILPRIGGSIILKLNGPIKKPRINGINN